jgi:hypothetical protein
LAEEINEVIAEELGEGGTLNIDLPSELAKS